MTDEKWERVKDQVLHLPDYDVVRLWQLCQKELEERDEKWPKARGWRSLKG